MRAGNDSDLEQVQRLADQLAQREQLLAALHASSSWRLTAPLRWAGLVAKGWLNKPAAAPAHAAPALRNYAEWIRQFDSPSAEVSAKLRAQIDGFAVLPLFSILMPVVTTKPAELEATINSVRQQIYPNWELCLAASSQTSAEIRTLLARCSEPEPRIKVAYVAEAASSHDVTALYNHALTMVSDLSDWIVRLNANFSIAAQAINVAAVAVSVHDNSQIIYTDVDVLDTQRQRTEPVFKPDWNLDLHLSCNLIGCCGFYRTSLVQQVGGYQFGMAEALDFDLSLRCLEHVTADQIVHLPYVLFHGAAAVPTSDAGVQALNEHFSRQHISATVEKIGHGYRIHYALPKALPLVSLIIPTRNGLELLRLCIESIFQKTSYSNFEIIIVDNGSDDLATLAYFKDLAKTPQIRILRIDAPFNYSALNNAAVKVAKGELIGLVNNDIEVISPDWLDELVSHALRPGVGAVGARLWFPDDTLQHGGVVLGLGGVAGHVHMGIGRNQLGYQGRAGLTQNLSAVTAACLVVKKSIFEAVGGLNEQDLAVAFNDVDFCLRVLEAGYRNVWTPFAELYHHESASRGYEDTPEKQQRFSKEVAYMHQRWGKLLQTDPAYNPNLSLSGDAFSYAWPPRLPTLMKPVTVQPGQPPLYDRLASLAQGKVRIAYFAENVHSSTFRYRAANMAEVLNNGVAAGDVPLCAACFFSSDLQQAALIAQSADVLVISRARYDPDLAALVQQFKTQGKRAWFDVDDLVFDTQKIDLMINTAGQQATDDMLNYWYSVVGRMAQALRLCDGVVTTHAYLANKIKLFSNLPVKVVPNFVNAAQLAVSEPLYQGKLTAGPTQRERIKLGYFSGSSSHNGDLSLIAYALERVMAADARIDFVLVGHVDIEQAFGTRFGGYLKGHLADRVTVHPFVDFLALQELIADVDFNLVPLQVNDFTHCKSELKFVDAAIVGTLTIASPAFAYAETIRHGENGYLAEDDKWETVLLQAIAVRDADFEKHKRMTAAAYQDVQQRFTWQTQRPAIMQALEVG